ncbi:hypothetical protein BDA99DRAFT_609683, partial [Phascolomyces articulosus]
MGKLDWQRTLPALFRKPLKKVYPPLSSLHNTAPRIFEKYHKVNDVVGRGDHERERGKVTPIFILFYVYKRIGKILFFLLLLVCYYNTDN